MLRCARCYLLVRAFDFALRTVDWWTADGLRVTEAMPFEPGKDVWGALLSCCRLHDDMKLAGHADPLNAGRYDRRDVVSCYSRDEGWTGR
jgi:hypothetical protein